jgi:hypothetical protein
MTSQQGQLRCDKLLYAVYMPSTCARAHTDANTCNRMHDNHEHTRTRPNTSERMREGALAELTSATAARRALREPPRAGPSAGSAAGSRPSPPWSTSPGGSTVAAGRPRAPGQLPEKGERVSLGALLNSLVEYSKRAPGDTFLPFSPEAAGQPSAG